MKEPTDEELTAIARAALETLDYPEDAPIFRALYNAGMSEHNPWPALDVRYAAAERAALGDQLTPEELTPRIRIELSNAFADGALWQYHRSLSDGDLQ